MPTTSALTSSLTSTVTRTPFGQNLSDGFSVNFDGTNDFMSTAADDTRQDRTYTFWAKSTNTADDAKSTVFSHGSTAHGAFHLNWSAGLPLLYLGSQYWLKWNNMSAQDDSQWHFWAVVVDVDSPTSCILYVDGAVQAKNSYNTAGAASGWNALDIGKSTDQFMQGNIDEFCVFDGHLTEAQVVALYNAGVPTNPVVAAKTGVATLENWWRMGDGGSTSIIPDEASPGVGAELITGFTNGSTYPLDTLTTSGRDISSAISLSSAWKGCASNSIPATTGRGVYEVSFNLTYNSGSHPVNVRLVNTASGSSGSVSILTFATNTNGVNTGYVDINAGLTGYLEFSCTAAVAINFSATDISLKQVNGKPGILESGAAIQTDAP